ncbi:mono/diheme cytochrome c family protein [Archangium gephyra]|uniref:Cytochrome c class I n=1 Tax=Archangium gephyra TaxID=48 RepID=A0AAC8QG95_9BACT|nr:cytochrome c [Archangium gephyra]AKJ06591.1 cytochrome c class I [Archangium gephyra]REG32098.1 mono/diheme cytochrome c family protein [Archangium gephyra]
MKTKGMGLMLAVVVSGSAIGAETPKATPELLSKGKSAFTSYCQSCHGEKGEGNGPAGMYLVPKPRNFGTEAFKKGDKPEEVFKTISTGIPGSAMVPFTHLPEQERWALTHYVLELQKQGKAADAKGKKKGAAKK